MFVSEEKIKPISEWQNTRELDTRYVWYIVQHIKLSLNANASTKHKRHCKLLATQGAAKQLLFSLHLSARNFIATTFFHLQPFFATSPVQKVVALDENIIIPFFFF